MTRRPTALPEEDLVGTITELTGLVRRTHPSAELVGRGVAFEQRVVVTRHGRPPAHDLRRGRRLRLECRLPGSAAAVAELVLPKAGPPAPVDLRRLADQLAQRAETVRDARGAPRGSSPVLLAPGVGGILVHEIVGHALEADVLLKGDSWLAQFEERVASGGLSVVDDPRRSRAAWRIDDEGEPSKPTPLIRDGRVTGRLHDCRSAKATGEPPTGHGRCSSYREPVRPRMGCTFVLPGKREPDELLREVQEGVYVRRMEAGTTDTRRGKAVFRVTDADRIRDGRIDAPLLPHLLFVDGARTLTAVEHVANDLVFDSCVGVCHREGQPLSISVGAPTMWIGLAGVSMREM
jgi:TldD protein